MKDKKLILLMVVLIVSTVRNILFAQSADSALSDSAGIYLTYEDFETGKLTNGFKLGQNKHSIWPQGFFKNKDIELKTPDSTFVYKRSDIWGYRDHRGDLIRIFDKHHYNVLCDKEMMIYIIYSPTRTSYHFSKTLNGTIYRLTRKNLTTIYADNPEFLDKINSTKKKHWLTWEGKKACFLLN